MSDELDLGCFSLSLDVADLDRSVAFYERLGFRVLGGEGQWRILGNGSTKLGLFEGIIDANVLTFNPGLAQEWDDDEAVDTAPGPGGEPGMPGRLADFTDVREIEQALVDSGIDLDRGTETPDGADHLMLTDPDGNRILIDQFF